MPIRLTILAALGLSLAACAAPGSAGRMQVAQERQACANLGIDPGSPAFASCVGNLAQTIDDDQNIGLR